MLLLLMLMSLQACSFHVYKHCLTYSIYTLATDQRLLKTMLALHFASIVCKIELFIVYLQGSFDLVKSFVTRRPEHGGFLVIITLSMVDVVF